MHLNSIQKLLTFIVLLVSALSCSPLEVDELYIQRVKGSSLVIYDYYASGGLDTEVGGFTIQDSTQPFQILTVKELPISNFIDIPNAKSMSSQLHSAVVKP